MCRPLCPVAQSTGAGRTCSTEWRPSPKLQPICSARSELASLCRRPRRMPTRPTTRWRFVKAWDGMRASTGHNLKAWLFTILRNEFYYRCARPRGAGQRWHQRPPGKVHPAQRQSTSRIFAALEQFEDPRSHRPHRRVWLFLRKLQRFAAAPSERSEPRQSRPHTVAGNPEDFRRRRQFLTRSRLRGDGV